MIFGYLLGRKTYSLQKIVFVLLIVAGVILFIYKNKYDEKDGEDPLLGNSLIAISLLMDGFEGASQDRMRQASKPTALNLMYYLNFWSSGILLIGILAFGETSKFIDFVSRYPEILQFFGLSVLVGAVGQYFRSLLIADFGPLPFSIASTVRKFFSVLFSVVLFGNSLSLRQICAAGLIFGVLFLDAILNKGPKKIKIIDEDDATTVKLTEINDKTVDL